MEYNQNYSTFIPHKVIKTADGQTIILQDLDQDLEQHKVESVANQRTAVTMSRPIFAPCQGISATPPASCVVPANQGMVVATRNDQNSDVQMPTVLAGLTSDDEPCFVNPKQYKR